MSDDPRIPTNAEGHTLKEPTAEEMAAAEKAVHESPCNAKMPLPQVDFSTFVLSLYSSAMVSLGEVPDPQSGKVEAHPPLAKHAIDMLTMLKEKVETGPTNDERRLLDALLYELRMKFVMQCK